MDARISRLYYEEVEEMVINTNERIAELKERETLCEYEEDKIIALTDLVEDLNRLRR